MLSKRDEKFLANLRSEFTAQAEMTDGAMPFVVLKLSDRDYDRLESLRMLLSEQHGASLSLSVVALTLLRQSL